jgi:hypothetical protein
MSDKRVRWRAQKAHDVLVKRAQTLDSPTLSLEDAGELAIDAWIYGQCLLAVDDRSRPTPLPRDEP